jgi:hypothetical protein
VQERVHALVRGGGRGGQPPVVSRRSPHRVSRCRSFASPRPSGAKLQRPDVRRSECCGRSRRCREAQRGRRSEGSALQVDPPMCARAFFRSILAPRHDHCRDAFDLTPNAPPQPTRRARRRRRLHAQRLSRAPPQRRPRPLLYGATSLQRRRLLKPQCPSCRRSCWQGRPSSSGAGHVGGKERISIGFLALGCVPLL